VSRHRGQTTRRRCERWRDSLLSPGGSFYPMIPGPLPPSGPAEASLSPRTTSSLLGEQAPRHSPPTPMPLDLWLTSNQPGGARAPPLRFVRRPPQSNSGSHYKCPAPQISGKPLEPKSRKGGISLTTPPLLRRQLQSLPTYATHVTL